MDKLTKGWVQHQRKAARLEAASRGNQCPFREAKVNSESEAFKAHYSLKHPALAQESKNVEAASNNCTLHGFDAVKSQRSAARPKDTCTQITGVGARKRRAMSGNPDLAESSSSDNAPASGLIRQPDTRPITSDQLRAEVEGIYAGLALLESKCIEYDASQKDAALDEEQYGPLIFLHRSLLNRTFPPASQHPSANGALQPLNSKRNVRHGPKERSVLPITMNGKIHRALADTMASGNVMSKKYAASIGAAVDRSRGKQHAFMNAIGKRFRAIGETTLEVSFPDEPLKKTWQTFAVVKKCAAELVMGDAFLRMTETLTKFKARREKDIGTMKKSWRLCYMGAPHRQLICSIDGEAALASADTGSDIDVVSLEYAKRRGWAIHDLEPDNRNVELSDGSIVQLAGYVGALLNVGGRLEKKIFYVLDRLQCHVLLGDETLHSLDAFNQHEALFVDEDADAVDWCPRFCAIKWKERVDDHVNQILDNKLPAGFLSAFPNTKKRSVGRRLFGDAFGTSLVEEMRAWTVAFQRSLEIIETIETDSQNQANKQMESLTGDDLQIAKESDERRRRQYQEQKNRTLAQMQEFQRSWTAFDKHTGAVPLAEFV